MNDNDFASADAMVLGTVVSVITSEEDMKAHVMKTCEQFGVQPGWFRDNRHKKLWEAVEATWRETRTLDLYHLKERYEKDTPGFAELFEQLIGSSAMVMHIEHYLRALKAKWIYGRAHKLIYERAGEMKPDNIDLQLEDLVRALHDLQEDMAENDNGLRQLSDFMAASVAMKEKLHEERFVKHNWEFMDGLPYPWHEVNQIFSGLKTGLHVVGALASQGKSTMAADLSVFWNFKGIKHGYICIDMAAEQLTDRYPCIAELVSLAKLNFGGSGQDVAKFKRGYERCVQANNVWVSEADDAKTIEYQCYRGVKSLGWKAIIIDYIQLVTPDEKGNLPEYTKVQHAVQAVKKIAKKLKVPIVCLAQLSRAFEKELREGKYTEPGLDAIGDSAEIARAASSVTVLYQDEDMRKYWKETPPTQLAFGDKCDAAIRFGVVLPGEETEKEAEARRNGQMSLAKSVRPVWFEVLKNQQGGKGKIPFVMFANYFLFRPGNSEGEDIEVTVGGKQKKLPVGKFEQLRDDWIYTDQDWWLEMTNALPQRGCKLLGETYHEMWARIAKEREAHPEVRHFVRERDENGRETGGWHFVEATEAKTEDNK